MNTLANPSGILFVVTSMLASGLAIWKRDIFEYLHHRGLIARLLVANLVIVPALGWVITRAIHMPTYVMIGFLLMASAPGYPLAIRFTHSIREQLPFAITSSIVLMIACIITLPFIAHFVLPSGAVTRIPYSRIMLEFVAYLIVPLALGIYVHVHYPDFAAKALKWTNLVSTIFFVAWVVSSFSARREARETLTLSSILGIAILIVLSMAVGWILGGPDRGTRTIMAVSTSMRNAAVCALVAIRSYEGTSAGTTIIAFTALLLPMNFLLTFLASHTRHGTNIDNTQHRQAA